MSAAENAGELIRRLIALAMRALAKRPVAGEKAALKKNVGAVQRPVLVRTAGSEDRRLRRGCAAAEGGGRPEAPALRRAKMDTGVEATGAAGCETAQRVIAVRFGRGRVGGSTGMDLLIQRARRAGRKVLIGDGDLRNSTLAGWYPPGEPGGASQPLTDEIADVKEWITELLGEVAAGDGSLVLDMGGGDRVLSEYHQDFGIVDFAERCGMRALAVYVMGPDMDDFEHVLTIWRAGYFQTPKSVLIMNEHLVRQGKTPAGAFDRITERPEMAELLEGGMCFVLMPRLPCLTEMRDQGLGFFDAAARKRGRNGKPFDLVRAFMVEEWLKRMEKAFVEAGVAELLP
jgi:hypothetical protein